MWNEQIMGMAYDASMDQIYYRADWWQEAGIEVPWQPATNAELLDTLRLIKEQRPDAIPWSMFGAQGEGVNYLFAHMRAAGVPFEGATPQLESEAGIALIDWYQTVIREGLTSPDVLALGGDDAVGLFLGGRAATIIESIGLSNDLGGRREHGIPRPMAARDPSLREWRSSDRQPLDVRDHHRHRASL